MNGTKTLWLVAALLCAACTEGGGGDDDRDAALGEGDGAAREAGIWDAGEAGPQPDEGVPDMAEPDAAEPVCFAEGGGLVEASISDPFFGLTELRADVDPDADGRPDLLLRRVAADGHYFELRDGRTLDPMGTFGLLGAVDAIFMPGVWPMPERLTPIDIGGAPHWVVHEILAEGGRVVLLDAADSAEVDSRPLTGAGAVHVVTGPRPMALVDYAAGGCVAYGLDADGPTAEWGLCRLAPTPDVNGDAIPEVVRYGRAGLEMFDGASLESIAFEPDIDIEALGQGPEGPMDVRGNGPEFVSAAIDGAGALEVRYHDPIELRSRDAPQVLRTAGVYTRARFIAAGGVLRIVAEIDRNGQLFLHLIEPGRDLRRLGEFGPFQVLRWGTPGDIDGDGVLDIELRGGSTMDGTNTNVQYLRVRDGVLVYQIDRERNARFDPIWAATRPPSLADLDGCPGPDRVLLRSGVPRANGLRASRVIFLDEEGLVRDRSEPYDVQVHALTIADLDGQPPYELLEIRSENDSSARLRVYTPRR